MNLQPSKHEAVIRVGVTGHRFLAELEKLQAAVARALERIQQVHADATLTCVSPLAEGADQLVAKEIVGRGGALVVPLPLPVEEYLSDFATEASQRQFHELLEQAAEIVQLPSIDERNKAYEQVGLYVLDHCDVIIAIYDGQPAQGRGGTADIVRQALARGMPVVHIKAGNRKPGTNEPTTLGDEQGELVVHNL